MQRTPSRNIELKSLCRSLEAAHAVAQSLPASRLPDQRQRDTYFHCANGRLKLREINGQQSELIWYARGDEPGPKASSYYRVPVEDSDGMIAALREAWGIRGIVEKHRAIYLYRNVRIHLDQVRGLGEYLEFEAVLAPDDAPRDARQLLDQLSVCFRLDEADRICVSYGELIDHKERP